MAAHPPHTFCDRPPMWPHAHVATAGALARNYCCTYSKLHPLCLPAWAIMQVGGGYSSFLMPFDTTLWVLLLATLVFTSLLLFLVDHISRKARLKAFGQIHGLARLQERRKRGEG